ncbi:NADP-dependent oxidoreductase [Kitasatospora atroaurantiaca]|uniref:NADPH:quinone reductase-like Zn-dependent oxidoreductase n=1 Tax=Kitasatospora atroaurantiaca TaxID=285545 RepID=A0A561ESR8_9ACTN|nr:NADP-dependent oxidoreductase [Kitasatospora atroaurantiaca]TWE18637.1 NADPH:quinone reductase-like Zn-dependent oxidoreductase [Kitasatospora atroaurantiaca]TWE18657.1 NADPH:quinone reductase-like Zn-dependent oxidoreductase [Kitasatospora atroaurantiaca]
MSGTSGTSGTVQRMRAVSQDEFGGPEVLRVVERDRPQPGPTEILVRVHAAGVNPTDWKTRSWGGVATGRELPFVLGYDVSGVVEAVGFGVTLFQPGDEVFGMAGFPRLLGAYAEFIAAPARHFVHKPAGIDHVQAAALPLVSLTAWQAFVDRAELRPGQRVLIHAAAGGVGHVAVQIAKSLGAYVIATASAGKHEFVRGLGADEVIDYTAAAFETVVAEVDMVLDTVGEDYSERSLTVLRDGGTLVSLTHPKDDALVPVAAERGIRAGFMLVEPDRRALLAVAELVESGQLRAEVAAVLPLAEAAKAHELGETGRTVGKLVLRVAEES